MTYFNIVHMKTLVVIAIAAVLLISAFVIPWVNRRQIRDLRESVKQLKELLLSKGMDIPDVQSTQYPDPVVHTQAIPPEKENAKEETVEQAIDVEHRTELQSKSMRGVGFEQQFGARFPVWIGGVALALAGFFLVKFSMENNFLDPVARLALGGVLGIALLYSAKWVRGKPGFANGVRIAQSLAGAGIAVLYAVSFASARLYELIPMFAGFAAMAAVTAMALVLSLRHGSPIALLGMVGGFLTPALLGTGGESAFSLFAYLYFTTSGLLIVARKNRCWWLSIPTIIISLLWAIVWLLSSYHPGDSIWLGLFLVGISATIVISSKQQGGKEGDEAETDAFKFTSVLSYIGLGGALMLMGVVTGKAGFGFMEWGLFGLLAVSGIILAYFDDKLYGFVPWTSMAVNAVMLFIWSTQDHALFSFMLIVFAAIYMASGYFLMFRARSPVLWAGLTGTTGLSYYLLAYYKLHATALFAGIPMFWGFAALTLATGAVYALFKTKENFSSYKYRDHLYAMFSVAATAFISLALSIELNREFLSVAIAGEILAIAWINRKVSINALRPIAGVLACVFGLLLLPQIMLVIELAAYSLIEAKLHLQSSIPIVQWPLFQLGVPAIMFLGSSYLLRQQKDDRLIRIFEIAAIALVAVMGYYFSLNALYLDQNLLFVKAGLFERGVITNVLFVLGLLCFWVGRRFERSAFSWSGIVLCGIAMFRIIYFDMLIHNPILEAQKIGGMVFFNALLLPYAFPLVWAYFAKKELVSLNREKWAGYAGGFMLAAAFLLISLNVRHIFHGEYLNAGITTNAEVYTYSAAWLLLGIALLFAGIIKRSKMLRYASLGVVLLTVGKVFLYDASELEGLYRVFSFFGLGISLIGLSYFYTWFVFRKSRDS